MAEYIQNQRYLHSVDPDISPEARNQNQIKRIMQQVTRSVSRAAPPPSSPTTPVSFRQPRENLGPVLAPWDNIFTTGVLQEQPDLEGHLLALKYDKMRERVQPLVKHMLSNLPEGFDPTQYDVIVPTPIDRRTRKRRGGYNQTELLGKALSKQLNIPMDRTMLRRAAPPIGQDRLPRTQRRAGIQESVRVDNASRLHGKRVLLLDDLITSGTTAEIMTRKLRQAGAGGVDVMALARSDRRAAGGGIGGRDSPVMDSFLGIRLLSGRNEPRYPMPRRPQRGQAGRQRQIAAQQRRVLANQEEYERDLRSAYRQLVRRYGPERGGEMYRQQSRIARQARPNLSQLQERADRAMDTISEAQSYYNQAQAQNVSVHLGYGGSEPQWVGSGTYTAPGQVLTAEHAVRGVGGARMPRPSSGYVRNLDTGLVEFPITQVLLEDAESDVALLETVAHRAQQAARPGSVGGMRVDPRLSIVGADLHEPGSELFDPATGYRRQEPARYMGGIGRGRHTLAGYAQQGMSGGAMYDSLGRMVGMTTHARRGRTVSGPGIDEIQRVLAGRRDQDAYGLRLTSGRAMDFYPGKEPFQVLEFAKTLDPTAVRSAPGMYGAAPWVAGQMLDMDLVQIGQQEQLWRERDPIIRREIEAIYDSTDAEKQVLAQRWSELAEDHYQDRVATLQENVLREIDGAVFQIKMLTREGATGVGTGFSPAPGQLLTNMHVIQPSPGEEYLLGEATRMGSGQRESFDFTTFLGADVARDSALIRIPEGFEHKSIPLGGLDFEYGAGTQVIAAGMPGAREGMRPGIVQRVAPGLFYRREGRSTYRASQMHTDMLGQPGLSGSPILAATERGLRAIAQHYASYEDSRPDYMTRHAFSTPAATLAPWIESVMGNLSDRPQFLSRLKLTSGRAVEPIVLPSGMVAAEHMTENIEALRRAGAITPAAQTGQTQLSVTGLHRFARDPESAFCLSQLPTPLPNRLCV